MRRPPAPLTGQSSRPRPSAPETQSRRGQTGDESPDDITLLLKCSPEELPFKRPRERGCKDA